MRLVAIETLPRYFITAGLIYDLEEGPTIYDSDFKPHRSFITKCDDEKYRKVNDYSVGLNINQFRDLQEVREKKLNELGI
mgnify:CR=1 FL=1|jgi:hypothetical protein